MEGSGSWSWKCRKDKNSQTHPGQNQETCPLMHTLYFLSCEVCHFQGTPKWETSFTTFALLTFHTVSVWAHSSRNQVFVKKGQSFFSIQFSNVRLSLMFKHSAWQMSTCLFLVICSFWVMNHTRLLHDYLRPEHGQLMALSFNDQPGEK